MKRIIYYILLSTSIFCLHVRYAVADSNTESTSEGSELSAAAEAKHGESAKIERIIICLL